MTEKELEQQCIDWLKKLDGTIILDMKLLLIQTILNVQIIDKLH